MTDILLDGWVPRYNVAPTQWAPVIVAWKGGRRLGPMRWGLVPYWATDPRIGGRLVNARSETARTRPAFRDAFARRRCIVPADGFYEWTGGPGGKGTPSSPRVPWWLHRPDRRPFGLAGLWERWRPPGGAEPLHSFTILTVPANSRVARLHDRMPAVLPDHLHDRWLDRSADPGELQRLLAPAPEDLLEAWPVTTRVNSPANEAPDLIEPLDAECRGDGVEGR